MDEPIRVCTWEALKFGFCVYNSTVQTKLLNQAQLFIIGMFLIFPCVLTYTLGYYSIVRQYAGLPAAGGPDYLTPADCLPVGEGGSQVGH
jgi:hypothetical protein